MAAVWRLGPPTFSLFSVLTNPKKSLNPREYRNPLLFFSYPKNCLQEGYEYHYTLTSWRVPKIRHTIAEIQAGELLRLWPWKDRLNSGFKVYCQEFRVKRVLLSKFQVWQFFSETVSRECFKKECRSFCDPLVPPGPLQTPILNNLRPLILELEASYPSNLKQ